MSSKPGLLWYLWCLHKQQLTDIKRLSFSLSLNTNKPDYTHILRRLSYLQRVLWLKPERWGRSEANGGVWVTDLKLSKHRFETKGTKQQCPKRTRHDIKIKWGCVFKQTSLLLSQKHGCLLEQLVPPTFTQHWFVLLLLNFWPSVSSKLLSFECQKVPPLVIWATPIFQLRVGTGVTTHTSRCGWIKVPSGGKNSGE